MTLQESRFSSEELESLDGPAWLLSYRKDVLDRLSSVTPATESVEDWRYSRIDQLDLADYGVMGALAPKASELGERARDFLAGIGDYSALVRVVDGHLVGVESSDEVADQEIVITSLAKRAESVAGLGELLGEVDEPFGVMNDAFSPDILFIDIPPSVYLERPIVLISELSSAATNNLSFARTLIHLGATSEASVVVFQSSVETKLLHIPTTEILLDDGAHLRFDGIQHLGERTWQLGYQLAKIGRDASLVSFAASLGGDYSRLYSRAALVGENAESKLFAAYLGVDTQVQEFRTFQDHLVGRTRSDLVFKGAVADHARSVYSGMIHMHKDARRSVASQTNRNLVLSEGAHADSVPNLNIEENDVQCSHASAVGPIDPDQRFYLESRGIPPEVAERLILLGFFDDLLARVKNVGCADYVRRVVTERLLLSLDGMVSASG